jgi:hypothetical protein
MVNAVKVLRQVLAHAVERNLIEDAVVRDERNDTVSAVKAIRGPAEKLHVWVVELAGGRCDGIVCVRVTDAAVDHRVLAVLIVVVLVDLADVVGRVSENHGDLGSALAVHTLGIFLGKQGVLAIFGALLGSQAGMWIARRRHQAPRRRR